MKAHLNFSFLIVISFVVLVTNCTENPSQKNIYEEIDIVPNIDNFSKLSLSQFNATIRYIPLRKCNDFELSRIVNIDASSDFILVSTSNMCLLYDYDGSLIRKIGKEGRGPNEYTIIYNSSFGLSNNIYIQVNGNFLEYGTDGTFLSSFNIKKINNPEFYISSWILINDSLFLGHTPLLTGKEETKAVIFNKKGCIMNEYKNYIFLNRSIRMFSSDDDKSFFYKYKGKTYFKEKMNDTLFCLTYKQELLPRISFRLGKYAMPKEFREKIDNGEDSPKWFNYIFVDNVFEMSDYLLLDCAFNKYMPAKRITPRVIMGKEIWVNTLDVLGLYDKNKKSLIFSKPTSTDNPLFTSGFYNNIDAGPRFYPLKQVNDSTMVMWIEAKQLKDHVESDDFKNNIPKYPEKKKELEELANKLTVFDNPVLMFVTFKNK